MLLLNAVFTYLYLTEGIDSHVFIPYYICIYLPYLIRIYLSVPMCWLYSQFRVGVCNQGWRGCWVCYVMLFMRLLILSLKPLNWLLIDCNVSPGVFFTCRDRESNLNICVLLQTFINLLSGDLLSRVLTFLVPSGTAHLKRFFVNVSHQSLPVWKVPRRPGSALKRVCCHGNTTSLPPALWRGAHVGCFMMFYCFSHINENDRPISLWVPQIFLNCVVCFVSLVVWRETKMAESCLNWPFP